MFLIAEDFLTFDLFVSEKHDPLLKTVSTCLTASIITTVFSLNGLLKCITADLI